MSSDKLIDRNLHNHNLYTKPSANFVDSNANVNSNAYNFNKTYSPVTIVKQDLPNFESSKPSSINFQYTPEKNKIHHLGGYHNFKDEFQPKY